MLSALARFANRSLTGACHRHAARQKNSRGAAQEHNTGDAGCTGGPVAAGLGMVLPATVYIDRPKRQAGQAERHQAVGSKVCGQSFRRHVSSAARAELRPHAQPAVLHAPQSGFQITSPVALVNNHQSPRGAARSEEGAMPSEKMGSTYCSGWSKTSIFEFTCEELKQYCRRAAQIPLTCISWLRQQGAWTWPCWLRCMGAAGLGAGLQHPCSSSTTSRAAPPAAVQQHQQQQQYGAECQKLATPPAGHNDSQAAYQAQSASSISSTVAMLSSTLTVTLQLLPWRDTSNSQNCCQ